MYEHILKNNNVKESKGIQNLSDISIIKVPHRLSPHWGNLYLRGIQEGEMSRQSQTKSHIWWHLLSPIPDEKIPGSPAHRRLGDAFWPHFNLPKEDSTRREYYTQSSTVLMDREVLLPKLGMGEVLAHKDEYDIVTSILGGTACLAFLVSTTQHPSFLKLTHSLSAQSYWICVLVL